MFWRFWELRVPWTPQLRLSLHSTPVQFFEFWIYLILFIFVHIAHSFSHPLLTQLSDKTRELSRANTLKQTTPHQASKSGHASSHSVAPLVAPVGPTYILNNNRDAQGGAGEGDAICTVVEFGKRTHDEGENMQHLQSEEFLSSAACQERTSGRLDSTLDLDTDFALHPDVDEKQLLILSPVRSMVWESSAADDTFSFDSALLESADNTLPEICDSTNLAAASWYGSECEVVDPDTDTPEQSPRNMVEYLTARYESFKEAAQQLSVPSATAGLTEMSLILLISEVNAAAKENGRKRAREGHGR